MGQIGLLPPVIIELQASITELKAKLGEAKTELDSMEAKGQSFGQKFAQFGTAAFMAVGAAAVGLGTEAIHLADAFEVSHARLTASLEANGTAFKEWSSQIGAADKAGEKLGFTNSDVEDGLARLETMVKNPTVALKDLAVAEDIARARGIDLTTASQLVGKASEGTYTALTKLGIVTKEQAKSFQDGAQAVDFLGKTFAGQASTYSETFAGKLQTLKATSEDLGKNLGLVLIPLVEKVASTLADGIHWIQDNAGAIKQWGEIIGAVVVPALGLWAVAQAHVAVEAFSEFLATTATRIQAFGAAATATAAELYTMAAAEVAAGGPLSLLAAGIAGTVATLQVSKGLWNDVSDAQRDWLKDVEASIPAGVSQVSGLRALDDSLNDQINTLAANGLATKEQSNQYDDLVKKLKLVDDALKHAQESQTAAKQGTADMTAALGDQTGASSAAAQALAADQKATDDAAAATKIATDAEKAQAAGLEQLKKQLDDAGASAESVTRAESDFQQKLVDGTAKLKANRDALSLNTQAGRDDTDVVLGQIDSVRTYAQSLAKQGDTLQQIAPMVQAHIDALHRTWVQAGLTTDQIKTLDTQYGLTNGLVVSTQVFADLNINTTQAVAAFQQLVQLGGSLFPGGPSAPGVAHAASGTLTKGLTIAGEGNPMYPEYVIPTDPQYRSNAQALTKHLVANLPGLATGGIVNARPELFASADRTADIDATGASLTAARTSAGLLVSALASSASSQVNAFKAQAAVGSGFGGPGYGALTSWLGVPYLWGGGHGVSEAVARRNGVDCSGLVDQVYGQTGNTGTQVNLGQTVNGLANAVAGDLLFYGSRAAGEPHHVGIYVGGGKQIDAPHTGANVRYDSIYSDLEIIKRWPNAPGAAITAPVPGGSAGSGNRSLGAQLAAAFGWDVGPEWQAFDQVANRESGWNQFARNASSGAYGIPQALPESKLPPAGRASGGSSPSAQIGWMLDYIKGRYGDPLKAWQHETSAGWYDSGKGILPKGLSMALNTTGANEMAVVVPQQASGAVGGVTVNVTVQGHVYGSGGVNELARQVTKAINQMQRGGFKTGYKN